MPGIVSTEESRIAGRLVIRQRALSLGRLCTKASPPTLVLHLKSLCLRGYSPLYKQVAVSEEGMVGQQFPFTSYDFWAYLSAGFLLLFAIDQATGNELLMRDSWTVVQGVVAVSLAYAVGQLVASASSTVFEKVLVARLLGYPKNVLFGQPKAWKWVQRIIPGYFEPLPEATQKAAKEKGGKVGASAPGEALFWSAFAYARATPPVMTRLNDFLNLYGFCRNTALVAFIDAGIFYWSYLQPKGPVEHLLWARIAFVLGIGMSLRYLKFYRHYSLEVFTAFAYKEPESKNP